MTESNSSMKIIKKITIFSVPLILSGLLQQLFNWVDALIVGNFIGETALAGVGATSSLYNLFIAVIVGFTSGLSVLFAQHHGEGKYDSNAKLLENYSIILATTFVAVSVLGIVFVSGILKLMNTPETLFDYAREYLLIIFMGIPFLALYNIFSAMLRAMGNSIIPFIAVLISSVINGVLDYIFVAFCNLGVSGAAVATVISQIAMTMYVIAYTVIKYPKLRFFPLKMKMYHDMIREGNKYGMPPAVQSSVSSIGNLFLQRFMNGFGQETVAAVTTAYRVDSVLFLLIINFSTAISTLVAQETGAGNKEVAKRIFKLGTVMMAIMSLLLTVAILFFGKSLLSMFGLTVESVDIGGRFFRSIAVFYIVYGLSMSIKGYLEGISDLLFSGIAGICSLGVRIVCSYLFKNIWGNMVIAYAEAFSWIFLFILFACRYINKTRPNHDVWKVKE